VRNLLQYPVTDEERVRVLTRMRETILSEQRMGDMRPLILRDAIAKFREPTEKERAERDVRLEQLRQLHAFLRGLSGGQNPNFEGWADALLTVLIEGGVEVPLEPQAQEEESAPCT
jgi:hypothetical protein